MVRDQPGGAVEEFNNLIVAAPGDEKMLQRERAARDEAGLDARLLTAKQLDNSKNKPAIDALLDHEVVIYPTDTGYAFGCMLSSARGIERLRRLKGIPVLNDNGLLRSNTAWIACLLIAVRRLHDG